MSRQNCLSNLVEESLNLYFWHIKKQLFSAGYLMSLAFFSTQSYLGRLSFLELMLNGYIYHEWMLNTSWKLFLKNSSHG